MYDLIYEIFDPLPRQGPGDIDSTKRALDTIGNLQRGAKVLDIGCGAGMQTIALAKFSQADITAIDNHLAYLDLLVEKAVGEGVSDRIKAVYADMNALKFKDGSFDVIWSEGAIYIMGFENGLREVRRLLVTKGYMAVTEITWLKDNPPDEVRLFFEREYPAMNDTKGNLNIIRDVGYHIIDYFPLPESAWWDDFYDPLEVRVKELKEKYAKNEEAMEVLKMVDLEIYMYRKYSDYYGYVFYIIQRAD